MIVFGKSKFLLQMSGLDPYGGRKNVVARIVFSVLFALFILLTSIFFILNFRRNIGRVMPIVPLYLGFTAIITTYFQLLTNRREFHSLLEDLQDIVHERMRADDICEVIYAKAAHRVHVATKSMTVALFSIRIMYLSPFVIVFYHWCTGIYTIDSWFFYYPVWTPFELDTASRCAIVVLFQAFAAACWVCVNCIVTCFLSGSVLYVEACLFDIKSIFVNRIDPSTKHKESARLIVGYVKDAVDLHQRVIRHLRQLTDITNLIIFVIVIIYTLCVCFCMFIVAKYTGVDFFSDLQMPLIGAVLCLSILFIYFYIGQRIHSSLMDLGDGIYLSDWYRYPRYARLTMYLMIMQSQRAFYLSAYGVIKMNMQNYVVMLKWLYSAFMLLRNMN